MGAMQPKQVGDGVAFLCSPAGRAVTGVSLPVDNGVHLKA
jgi:enoyl-[acyl-carrier-protein] reductase (NADH)